MSSSVDTDDVVRIDESGIAVTKRFAPDEFPVPAIRFEIDSSHDDPVTVRLTEDVPDSFPMDAVGFHPDYHSDQWTAYQDNRVEFTGEIEPDTSLVTVYGIRIDDEFDPSQFLTEPSISCVDSVGDNQSDTDGEADPAAVDDVIPEDRNEVVKTMLSDDRNLPGLDESADEADAESGADTDVGIELDIDAAAERVAEKQSTESAPDGGIARDTVEASATVTDRSDESPDTIERSDSGGTDGIRSPVHDETSDVTSGEADSDEGQGSISSEAVGDALASAIRTDAIADDDLRTIRRALEIDSGSAATAKVDHLQSRVEEVAAYAGAMEEFLNEEGTGMDLIEDVRAELSSVRRDVDAVQTDLDESDDTIGSLEDAIETVETTVSDLESTVSTVDSELESVSSSVENLDDSMADSVDRLDSVESTQSSLEEAVDSLDTDVAAVTDDLDELNSTVSEVESNLAAVREDVTDIVEWRDQLGSMFTED